MIRLFNLIRGSCKDDESIAKDIPRYNYMLNPMSEGKLALQIILNKFAQ